MEVFEVGLIGGPAERWYRKARPGVEAMPWGTLPLADVAPEVVARARRVFKDEAVHGEVGAWFFSWCIDAFDADERAHMRAVAHDEIGKLVRSRERFRPSARPEREVDLHGEAFGLTTGDSGAGRLGWMPESIYFSAAHAALESAVLQPLAALGLDPREHAAIPEHP